MSKTRYLDRAINMLRPTETRTSGNLRPMYEQALRAEGWLLQDNSDYCSEWHRNGTRMNVYNGDKVAISFKDTVRWHFLNTTARRKLLLPSQ